MTRRGLPLANGRPVRRFRRDGRPVAARALGQIRLLAVALLLVGGAGYRPSAGAMVPRGLALPLAGVAAGVLLLVALASALPGSARPGRRTALALVSTCADAAVVLGVVCLAGLPPHSFALVLLMLPFLEAALWFGLRGLAVLWTASGAVLGVSMVLRPPPIPDGALSTLVVAMPTLLLATIPVALLAEHLVAQVGRLGAARETADDRARLLGDLSAITADIFPLDADAVVAQLVSGAHRLGALGAVVVDPRAGRHASPVLAAAGDQQALLAEPVSADDASGEDPTGRPTVLHRQIAVPGSAAYGFTAAVGGSADEVARRTEALDLLVAQAGVALANAVLVQQLEQLKQTFQEQATRDQLTGLLNRRGLVVRAGELTGRLGVLFCDLDGFKGVNDTLGHAAGDELLEQVSHRLDRSVGPLGVLGRMGGDEFVVVLPDVTDDRVAALAGQIEVELGRPFLLRAGMTRIGVSIGIAHAAADERDLDDVLGRADSLMYEVKRARKAERGADVRAVGVTA